MLPIFVPSPDHKFMTDKNLMMAKTRTKSDLEWVIVESGSNYYEHEADIYIHEPVRTNPTTACNKGFKACTGDYVIFLSNDVEVCENWAELMLQCFTNEDCGIGSLGNSEAQDRIQNRIEEGLFFSVCMLKKEDAWLDPQYTRVFDDTDLIFRLHTQGKKFYKNLSGYVHHKPHTTLGEYGGDMVEFMFSKEYFKDKYKEYSSDPWYRRFTNG
jgi:GT2 family glycosyltransferase